MSKLSNIVAIREYFFPTKEEVIAKIGKPRAEDRPVTIKEMKALSPEDRQTLGDLCHAELS